MVQQSSQWCRISAEPVNCISLCLRAALTQTVWHALWHWCWYIPFSNYQHRSMQWTNQSSGQSTALWDPAFCLVTPPPTTILPLTRMWQTVILAPGFWLCSMSASKWQDVICSPSVPPCGKPQPYPVLMEYEFGTIPLYCSHKCFICWSHNKCMILYLQFVVFAVSWTLPVLMLDLASQLPRMWPRLYSSFVWDLNNWWVTLDCC